jgi:uncharacterized protein (UPF0332 family)
MAFNFDLFETVARELSKNPCEENIRVSISRAYYCLFHRAKRLVGDANIGFGTHEKVISSIRNNKDIKKNFQISKQLEDFKQDRTYADYKSHPPIKFDTVYLDRFWSRFDLTSRLISEAFEQE